jgi:transposase
MAKYSFEFKKKIVMEYINGKGGTPFLAKKYGIPSESNIRKWVSNYKTYGDKGLRRSRNKQKYSFEKKLAVVELYLSSEISYQELALKEGILNPALIVKWVNDFRLIGPDALRPRKKGRKEILDRTNTNSKKTLIENANIDTSVEHIKELEDELLKLRIENAFLKELRRLRLEDEAKMRDLHESSTVSEDNSN